MRGCAFAVLKLVLMLVNITLLNFQPTSAQEAKIFFAGRSVMFIMLLMDYFNILLSNNKDKVEMRIGVFGAVLCAIFAGIDFAGMANLLKLTENYSTLSGNSKNLITSIFPDIPLSYYALSSTAVIILLIGIEAFNRGKRYEFEGNRVGESHAQTK
ncbi:hypothetical protein [Lysinibacillus xylanilyticus]|uniref:hypothetical protein n=1 Tax=Lysinibacillus xylanilyticus TaxID=582475 RepID=UPI003CFE0112